MTREEIIAKVTAIVVDKLGVNPSEVTLDATFAGDLNADSLDTVELIMEFEKEFGVAIQDEDAQGISTVEDAVNLVIDQLGVDEESKN